MSGFRFGNAVNLADCVVPIAQLPTDANGANGTFVGKIVWEGDVPSAACVRASFDNVSWYTGEFFNGAPLWQVNLYVLEAGASGGIVTCLPLRARGKAKNIAPGRVSVGVSVTWIGGGPGPAPGSPTYPQGLVQVTVTDLRAQWSVQQLGSQLALQGTGFGPYTFVPDMVYENATFVGRRFCEAIRVHWRTGVIAIPGPVNLWTYNVLTSGGVSPVFGGAIYPTQPTGYTDIPVDWGIAVSKSFQEVSLSFEALVYE